MAPTGEATSRQLERLRNAVGRIASFGESRPEKAAIDCLGDAVSEWRQAQRISEEFEHLFERPIKVSEVYTEWAGTTFVRNWFAAAKIVSQVLSQMPEMRSGQSFELPKQITELQGLTLPELFSKTYPSLKFGGKNKVDQPVGHGFDFVGSAMVALGYDRPANETIQAARKKIRKH